SRTVCRSVRRHWLWQFAAGRHQRHRRRQGAESPHRFPGEIADVLSGSFSLGLAAGLGLAGSGYGLDRGGSSRSGRIEADVTMAVGVDARVAGVLSYARDPGPPWLLARPRPPHVCNLSVRLRHRIVAARLGDLAQHEAGVDFTPSGR